MHTRALGRIIAPLARCLLLGVSGLAACGGSAAPIAATGDEKGSCYANGTCNAGLTCFSKLCVRFGGAGADDASVSPAGGEGAVGAGGAPGVDSATKDGSDRLAPDTGDTGVAAAADSSSDGDAEDRLGAVEAEIGDAIDAANCPTIDGSAPPEVIVVPPCGLKGGTSVHAYGGRVIVTVSGVITYTNATNGLDAFYEMDPTITPPYVLTAARDVLRYNRLSEGTCLCFGGGHACSSLSHQVSDILVGPYPAFNASHEYTIELDLGSAPPERLDFGFNDCGCDDNKGGYTVKIAPAPGGACMP